MNSVSTFPKEHFHGFRDGSLVSVAFLLAFGTCGFTLGAEDPTKSPSPPGWLGLAIDDSLVPGRLVVVEIDADGPAAKAGVRMQDMVLAIDGEPTLDAERFAAAIATITPGENVRFSIARGGTVEELTLVAAESPQAKVSRPSEPPVTAPSASGPAMFGDAKGSIADEASPRPGSAFGPSPSPFPAAADPASQKALQPPVPSVPKFSETPSTPDPWQQSTGGVGTSRSLSGENGRGKTALGVRTIPVDQVVQARYSLPEPSGALVVGLVDDLPASRAGVPTGSVIVAFDRQPVRSPTELTKLVSEGPTDRPVKLEYILPGGESRAAEVSLVSVTASLAQSDASPSTATTVPGAGIGAEIRELRRTIESLTRRLDELERRALEQR